jgi:hypothetical protein
LSEVHAEPGSSPAGGGVSFLLLHVAEIKAGNALAGEKISSCPKLNFKATRCLLPVACEIFTAMVAG